MTLTGHEMAVLSRWEVQMRTAIRSHYLRNVGRSGLQTMIPIYERATGSKCRVNTMCSACILEFLQKIGEIYFADKAQSGMTASSPDKTGTLPR